MRHRFPFVVGFVLSLLGLAGGASAQPVPSPIIQRVTLAPDTGVLTITGTGLGADLIVSVEGQSVAVLPGATDTQLQVQAPEPMLATPGTYRLTVVDPARRVGDGFIVVSTTGDIAVASAASRSASRW